MEKKIRYIVFRLPAIVLLSYCLLDCANIGNPNGGPYDETPPRYVGSRPAMNQLNFTGKRIEIFFNEFISIENPSENIIITPPQKQNPAIQAIGKKIRVELKDTLIENTTYTLDFTSSIVDYNEKNALENFSFAFSTGDVLDTLQVSGIVINAEDMEVVQKMLVGIHSDLSDTAFTTTPFLRTSKTNDKGRFVIKNIAPGSYRVFALEDRNRNYAYDKSNDEGLAFLDSLVFPTCERVIVADTLWKDSVTIDTVRMVERTQFYPNDLILWFFKDSIAPRQRMLRPERSKQHIFTLKFNAPMDTFPSPVPLNFEPADSVWYITQPGQDAESFSINYWVLDSMIYKKDTLQLEVTYWKNNDSIPDLLELKTDTLSVSYREPPKPRSETRTRKPPQVRRSQEAHTDSVRPDSVPVVHLQMNISPSGTLNPYDDITVMVNEPVLDVQKEFFVLELGVDTLWEAVDFEFEIDTTRAMTYLIKRPFGYEERYRLTVDSALLTSVYNHSNNLTTAQMTVKGKKDYGMYSFDIQELPVIELDSGQTVMPAFVELLNSSGAMVRKVTVENGKAVFMDVSPEKYYVRIILDANGNGRWDAGSYEEKRQPESIFYLMNQIEVRQNWDNKDTWDISKATLGSKPADLIKNKPKEEQRKKRDYREESKPQKSGNSMSGMPGVGGIRF